jgi:hypothetical protein
LKKEYGIIHASGPREADTLSGSDRKGGLEGKEARGSKYRRSAPLMDISTTMKHYVRAKEEAKRRATDEPPINHRHTILRPPFDHLTVNARAPEFILEYIRIFKIAVRHYQRDDQGVSTVKCISEHASNASSPRGNL